MTIYPLCSSLLTLAENSPRGLRAASLERGLGLLCTSETSRKDMYIRLGNVVAGGGYVLSMHLVVS
jgi:hypothetical protein